MNKKFLIFFILFYILSFKSIYASDFYFEENFNEDYSDIVNWEINSNGPGLSFDTYGSLLFSSNSNKFPYLKTVNNIFPLRNFEVEFKFKYLPVVSDFGNGIALSDLSPINGGSLGEEHSIIKIWQDNTNKLRIETSLCSEDNPDCILSNMPFKTNELDFNSHVVKYTYINGVYKIFIDNNLVFTSSFTTRRPDNIWLGNPRFLSSAHTWSSFSVDYIRIKSLPDKELDVPFFSQNDTDWGSDKYDHIDKTIDQVGCALTSSVMLFRYYDMDLIPFIYQDMNPGNLNYWLTNKPQQEGLVGNSVGYTSNGGVSWIALNQLARFYNPYYSLEIMSGSLDNSDEEFKTFKENINDDRPEILHIVNGVTYWDGWDTHFVVGKGYDDEYIYINDPEQPENGYKKVPLTYDISKRLALFYDEDWEDWGKIQWHVNKELNVLIEDTDGNKLGKDSGANFYNEIDGGDYMEGEMMGNETSNDSVNIFLSKVVPGSKYKVRVYGDEGDDFDLLMQSLNTDNSAYDINLSGVISEFGKAEFTVNFSNDENNSLEEIVLVSYESIAQFINEQYEIGNIKHKGLMKLLLNFLDLSEKFYERENIKLANLFIDQEIKLLDKVRIDKQMELETRDSLIEMLEELKENLE